MQERLNMQELSPKAYSAIMGMESYISNTSLKEHHYLLIKLCASLINKCAFCIDMHSKHLRQQGETDQRMHLISAWRETNLFSPEEQMLFTITEELTYIHQHGLQDDTYTQAVALFGEEYLSHIIMAVCAINVWNRLAVATNMGSNITAE